MSLHAATLRNIFDDFNRRDFDAALRHLDPEVVLEPALHELDVLSSYRGHEEVRQFFETITDAWETYEVTLKDLIDASGDRVVAIERWEARGRQGIEFAFELIDVYAFRDGLVVRIEGFRDMARALDSVGRRSG